MGSRRGAAAIVIGDEVLSGKVRDQNGPYLIERLRAVGQPLQRLLTVGDDLDEIVWALSECRGRFSPIFTSGGIGPTHDDLTVAAVAAALGRPVVRHPEIAASVLEHYGDRGHPEALRLANVPQGAVLLRSPKSWYPVITVEEFHLLPGVPQLFRMHVDALVERFTERPFHLRCVFLNEGETAIAAILDRVATEHPEVSIGSYPRFDELEYRVKVTLEGKEPARVDAAVQALLAALSPAVVIRVE